MDDYKNINPRNELCTEVADLLTVAAGLEDSATGDGIGGVYLCRVLHHIKIATALLKKYVAAYQCSE